MINKSVEINSLDDRMKNYEASVDYKLTPRTPIIVRIDGKAFHTFTSGLKVFDPIIMSSMANTALELMKNIQGCELAYTQSDEISLLLINYKNIDSDPWFDNRIQKISSVCASMATLYFNRNFMDNVYDNEDNEEISKYRNKLFKALFDARVYNIPKEDVNNYFIWRQRDAVKNSIQSYARNFYSYKQLFKLSVNEIQNKLFTEKGINWNNLNCHKKRGVTVVKVNKNILNRNKPTILGDTIDFYENRDFVNNIVENIIS